MTMKKTLAAVALALAIPASAAAETATFDCQLQQIVRESGSSETKDLSFKLALDTETGKAAMVGDEGPAELKVLAGNEAVTFAQLFPSGEVRTTTISRRGRAAHTRHSVVMGEVVPTIYHGECR